jgi:hypothetical protein
MPISPALIRALACLRVYSVQEALAFSNVLAWHDEKALKIKKIVKTDMKVKKIYIFILYKTIFTFSYII